MKKLFLDDIRTIEMVYPQAEKDEYVVVRTYHAFVEYIREQGLFNF